jgi:activating signal cointegrator complex subunit 3
MKRLASHGICVYIAPLKALARERLKEWQCKFGQSPLRWRVLELSGETRHDKNALEKADVLVCTPEKWDLISRGWRSSCDAQDDNSLGHTGERLLHKVRLLVLDEVHLLGEERGAVLEAIVSRTRFISRFLLQKQKLSEDKNSVEPTRIVALSTALANAEDLADWIGIDRNANAGTMRGLYNFRNSVRPVEIKVHSQGFSGRHYCPRMATMNKPCLAAIKEHSPEKPALIFVASRRQTRLTAFDLISYAAADDESKRFLRCSEAKIDQIVEAIHDDALRHTIAFGIGLHHAGLSSSDREIVERLFLEGDIQVLVATATLAWGVNLPAHLVIVKGTEYFDGRSSRYVQYPLTDVLQMIGRAGRPGFDTSAHAVVMSTVEMKPFYQKVRT